MTQAKNIIAALTSRRNFMKNAVAAVAVSAVPIAASAAVTQPSEKMQKMIEELKVLALEAYPNIKEWRIAVADADETNKSNGCPLVIAAFEF